MPSTTVHRIYNFSAGPAVLPLPVLEEAQRDLVALPGVGMSVLEISHRSKPFESILAKAEADIGWLVELISAVRSVRSEMNVPAAQQVPLVLVASKETRDRTGRWSDALKRLARLSEISFAVDTSQSTFILSINCIGPP